MTKKKDWTNQKHYRITLIEESGKNIFGQVVWKGLCDCGTIIPQIVPSFIARGHTKSCGCLQREIAAQVAKEQAHKRRRYEPIVSTARSVWHANYRECPFDIFYKLSQLPCHYCGRLPHKTYNIYDKGGKFLSDLQKNHGDFTYNGLDRIDNTRDHSEDNVVPCCWDCNHMKGSRTYEEFISHVKRILTYCTT